MYTDTIREISPVLTERQAECVECHMRVEYGTLDHLSKEKIASEIGIALACEVEMPGYLEMIAQSYGR